MKKIHSKVASRTSSRDSRSKRRPRAETFLEGIIIADSKSGGVIDSANANSLFNPASNTKVATTLAVIEKFGTEYRFATEIRCSGNVDKEGKLQGDLFVAGNYMLFGDRQARDLARVLNNLGIRTVTGNLYVSPDFLMNLHSSGADAGRRLLSILDPNHKVRSERLRNPEDFLSAAIAEVTVSGKVIVAAPSNESRLIATHRSPPLRDILKIMLCYSDNTMAELFGNTIGGPAALKQYIVTRVGVSPSEVNFASTSGLGVNRVSPDAMLKILTTLRTVLAGSRLSLSDLLAVAGIDDGTMKQRLNQPGESGSVVAKTGTLPETDQGASALCGEIFSADGKSHLFVIFHMHGDIYVLRRRQDAICRDLQSKHGGAKPIPYTPILPRIDREDSWEVAKSAETKSRKKREPRYGGYAVGDRVEIINYKTAISWGNRLPQRYGFIVNIDGAYIMVRPRWHKKNELIEFYANEIRPA